MTPEPLVFVALTGYQTRLPLAVRMDQIMAVVARAKRDDIESTIRFVKKRLDDWEQENPGRAEEYDPLMLGVDVKRERDRIVELERERDEPHAGSTLTLLDGAEYAVAESPEEVFEEMHKGLQRIAETT